MYHNMFKNKKPGGVQAAWILLQETCKPIAFRPVQVLRNKFFLFFK